MGVLPSKVLPDMGTPFPDTPKALPQIDTKKRLDILG